MAISNAVNPDSRIMVCCPRGRCRSHRIPSPYPSASPPSSVPVAVPLALKQGRSRSFAFRSCLRCDCGEMTYGTRAISHSGTITLFSPAVGWNVCVDDIKSASIVAELTS